MTKRKSPGGQTGASPKSIAADFLNHTPAVEALDEDARRELNLLVEVYDRGYRVAIRCKTCGSWLAAPKSVARHQGPVCYSRGVSA